MTKILLFLFIFNGITFVSQAQNFTGQWKGNFMDQSTKSLIWGGDRCEYVLELESNGRKVSGYSYTYFTEGSKRYYTICKLEGKIDSRNKYLEIREVERTKSNVPPTISNCFQVHKLTFFKHKDGLESLEGNWVPAPDQAGNCGYGLTSLSRRTLKPNYRTNTDQAKNSPRSYTAPKKPETKIAAGPITQKQIPVTSPRQNTAHVNTKTKEQPASTSILVPDRTPENIKETNSEKTFSRSFIEQSNRYEKRPTTILKTIIIESGSINIDLYDNGEVDGDSVSLFLNGKLIMAHQRLTTQPLSLSIPMEDLQDENELVMYADNLGTIPPNTALMVVTDGHKRYEIRITSDLQKSGTIVFVKKGR